MTWSPWGDEYARSAHYVFGTAPSDFALEVARLVRAGDAVLELGCGEGRDSVFFAQLGATVTGVDLSAAGIAKARQLARARRVRVTWIEGAMTDWLPAGPFELVFSCGSLHYLPRTERALLLRRLQAMTRAGGHQAHLVFTDRQVHEEKGELVAYFQLGELCGAFANWRILSHGHRVISCAQDGTVHGHGVEALVAASPLGASAPVGGAIV